jgi:hypothetical protein
MSDRLAEIAERARRSVKAFKWTNGVPNEYLDEPTRSYYYGIDVPWLLEEVKRLQVERDGFKAIIALLEMTDPVNDAARTTRKDGEDE